MKISVEKISAQAIRVTLTADIQVNGDLSSFTYHENVQRTSDIVATSATPTAGSSAQDHELLTVEEAAKILHVGRDKVYYLIRTGQLRSIKIGNLRRISRVWISEFIARVAD